jgi:hypothetical protein
MRLARHRADRAQVMNTRKLKQVHQPTGTWTPEMNAAMTATFHEVVPAMLKLHDLAVQRAKLTGERRDWIVASRYEQAIRLLMADSPHLHVRKWER